MTSPVLANLVCGSPARNHDFDFARIRLAQALYAAGDIRTDSFNNYDAGEAIEAGDLLVSYTSQVPVADAQCAALQRFLERGGRWFAVHASNSVRDNPHLPKLLGSRFLGHPPYTRFSVSVTGPTIRSSPVSSPSRSTTRSTSSTTPTRSKCCSRRAGAATPWAARSKKVAVR